MWTARIWPHCLRRIGRLPPDKATEIARKLCAGLAAAHAQGVLHRDLKPANIMIDGRGQVVITDFGLAGMAAELQNADIHSGTPAYMAPEQLSGKEVSAQSDLYALGLVLYEVFTGKPAFEANTLAELIRLRETGPPASVSSVVRDVDPGVERVIARCLDPDPRKRPASALAIAAALPGGDPLAAALAAGETPSPEMVAAAGATEGLRPAVALSLLAAIVAGMFVFVFFYAREVYPAIIRLELPPDALAVEAHRIILRLGYGAAPADRAWGFEYGDSYLRYMEAHKPAHADWTRIANQRPSPMQFWYRESPRPLETEQFFGTGVVDLIDPPLRVSGMAAVRLDPAGRLIYFEAVAPQLDTQAPGGTLDAASLFSAAGLDLARFKLVDPQWNALQAADTRAAWTGAFPGRPEIPIRIEAAAWRGKPVYFQIIGPWTYPTRMQTAQTSGSQRANQFLWNSLFVLMMVVGSLLSWRNLRSGRSDRQGAFRIASLASAFSLAVWVLAAHHVTGTGELGLFTTAAAAALLAGAQLWLAYIALEPFVRRHWPGIIITWTRMLSGGWRDPLVGRDILIGMLVGISYDLVIATAWGLHMRAGDPPSGFPRLSALVSFPQFASAYLQKGLNAITSGVIFLVLLFVLRVLLRKQWLAGVVFAGVKGLSSPHPAIDTIENVLMYGFLVVLLLRYGFLASLICLFVTDLIAALAFTTEFSAWYGTTSLLTILSLIGLAFRLPHRHHRQAAVRRSAGSVSRPPRVH